MEPTIYKPSIYKGAGIYKTGAEGGGIYVLDDIVNIVEVKFPVGKVVTATNGNITLISDDNGFCFFALKESGTWYFECDGVTKSLNLHPNQMEYLSFNYMPIYIDGVESVELYLHDSSKQADYINMGNYSGDYVSFVRTNSKIDTSKFVNVCGKFTRSGTDYTFNKKITEYQGLLYLYFSYQSTSSYNAMNVGFDENQVTPNPTTAEQIQLDYSTSVPTNIRLKQLWLE